MERSNGRAQRSSGQPPCGPGMGRRGALLCLATAALLASAPSRAGGAGDPTSAGWLRLETSLSITPEVLDSHWSSLVRLPDSTPDYSLASAPGATAWSATSRSPALVEISPAPLAAAQPQVYVRPQFALGTSSDSLRSWLRFAGLDASTCTAPLMKMHSTVVTGGAHAKVSVSARCSLH